MAKRVQVNIRMTKDERDYLRSHSDADAMTRGLNPDRYFSEWLREAAHMRVNVDSHVDTVQTGQPEQD